MWAARFAPDLALDTTFGSGGVAKADWGTASVTGQAPKVAPDDSIAVAGSISTDDTHCDVALLRLWPNGASLETFGPSGNGQVTSATRGWPVR